MSDSKHFCYYRSQFTLDGPKKGFSTPDLDSEPFTLREFGKNRELQSAYHLGGP
jgi:hypothetical protein